LFLLLMLDDRRIRTHRIRTSYYWIRIRLWNKDIAPTTRVSSSQQYDCFLPFRGIAGGEPATGAGLENILDLPHLQERGLRAVQPHPALAALPPRLTLHTARRERCPVLLFLCAIWRHGLKISHSAVLVVPVLHEILGDHYIFEIK
jgi:hypothetical protein